MYSSVSCIKVYFCDEYADVWMYESYLVDKMKDVDEVVSIAARVQYCFD